MHIRRHCKIMGSPREHSWIYWWKTWSAWAMNKVRALSSLLSRFQATHAWPNQNDMMRHVCACWWNSVHRMRATQDQWQRSYWPVAGNGSRSSVPIFTRRCEFPSKHSTWVSLLASRHTMIMRIAFWWFTKDHHDETLSNYVINWRK